MLLEPPEQKKHQRWVMTCLGVSVVLGVIAGQLVNSEDSGKLISLVRGDPIADLLVIMAVILPVIGGARLTVTLHPSGLVGLGALILLAALAGPRVLARVSPNHPLSAPFASVAILEFAGAAFLGAGLQRITLRSDSKPESRGERTKPK